MKLKNFLLGASLVVCGAAFGQPEAARYQVYVPDLDKTYFAEDMEQSEDEDGTTINLINILSVVAGDSGGGYDFVIMGTKWGGNGGGFFTCLASSKFCAYIKDPTE